MAMFALTASSHAADSVSLEHATIVTDAGEALFVQYGVEDLAGFLKDVTGNAPRVVSSLDGNAPVQIVVGTKSVQGMAPECLPSAALGEEGYAVRVVSKDGACFVTAAGTTPRGTKAALEVLIKAIRIDAASASVAASLNVSGKPALAKRGMHFNGWAFNYPYSFRSWREEDWQRYLDILAYQGVNLFYLWPFIEIMPVPLSPEDRAYLEECRRVVDYAQQKHGMEVWIMQCTNRVAKDRCGVADPRLRPYWRPAQEDLNPANPEHFKAIMESREAMYSIIDNVDGVCNIDSDPGFCPGSTLDDYVKVLQGCRELIDRHTIHGKQTKLINWMLWGWGREGITPEGLPEHQRATLQKIKQGLPEPWELICSQFGFLPADQHQFLPICKDEGVLGKAVFMPYGIIEFEPSYPKTNLEIDGIRKTFKEQVDAFPEMAGAMGNVQAPLLQFPDVYFFTSAMWDAESRARTEPEAMLELAGYLYPDQKRLVADCYLAMKEADPAKVTALANQLDAAVRDGTLGRPGLFGRKLFPDASIVAKSLVLQLRMRAAQESLVAGITPKATRETCEQLLRDYCDAYLAWDTTHGWHGLWGWDKWPPSDDRFGAVAKTMRGVFADETELNASLDEMVTALAPKYGEAAVREGCVATWKKLSQ
jgi:hypothetical protein